MNAAWRDYRALWNAAFAQRYPGTLARLLKLTPAAMLGGAALGWYLEHDLALVLKLCVAVPGALFLLCWMMFFVPGAVLLNSPASAALVPRVRRRLAEMLAAAWIGALVVTFLLAGSWQAVPLVGLYLVGFTLSQAGRKWGMALALPAIMWGVLQRTLPPAWFDVLGSAPALVAETLLLIALGAYAIHLMLPAGGDRHFERTRKLASAGARCRPGMQREIDLTPWVKWSLYRLVLRRDCRRRDARALLMHVLGPRVHWTLAWWPAALLVAICLLVTPLLLAAGAGGATNAIPGGGWALLGMFGLVSTLNIQHLAERIGKTRTEQALLRLAPLMPGADRINRQLAGGLLRAGLFSWGAITASVLALTALGGGRAQLDMQLALCSLSGLPLVASQLRDYARDEGRAGLSGLWWILLAAAPAVLLASAVSYLAALAFWPCLALAGLAVGVVLVTRRWRAMLHAPVAFPAGRLAA